MRGNHRMSNRMLVGVALLLLGAATAHAQSGAIRRGWRVAPTAAIKIHAPSGVLEVEGWTRDSVDVAGSLAVGESLFGGGSLTGLKLGAEGTATAGRSRMVVRVPFAARLVVRSGASHVVVRGLTGVIDIGSAAGDVSVTGTVESLTAESISGSVRVAATTRSLRARTTRGALDISARSDEAQLSSVSGPVTVAAPRLGRMRIETVDGVVRVRGALEPSGSLDIETFGGAVRLELPSDQRAALDLRASQGDISGRLASRTSGAPPVELAKIVTRQGTTAVVLQPIGGGGGPVPPVTIRTFRGRISVCTAVQC